MKMPEQHGTERLVLRRPRLKDAPAIFDGWAQQPSIYRVYATTDVEDIALRRLLEKAGLQCEGILRKYIIHPNISDVPRDSYVYAITK